MIQLTDKAAKAIKRFIRYSDTPILGLRIGVESGGCSGFRYVIEPAKQTSGEELTFETDGGVKIFLDPTSAPMIDGMTIDWLETLTESKFVFDNPNAEASCGCGDSFTLSS